VNAIAASTRPRRLTSTEKVAVVMTVLTLLIISVRTRVAFADHEVVIEANEVRPSVLSTTTERPVKFVNRSGRLAHVEFIGTSDEHHVFQVPGEIYAVFHRPGRHPYVIHLESGKRGELHGTVEVTGVPDSDEVQRCKGITVMEECIEP
jgi:hypothetical protein